MTETIGITGQFQRIRRYMLILMLAWTLIAGVSLGFSLYQHKVAFYSEIYAQAKGVHTMDMEYRNWVIGHGGVYVPATEKTPPSEFLKDIPERDVTTPSGRKLTLLNSSYMTREVHELMDQHHAAVRGHIASLKPINPVNRADAWERQALKAFEGGKKEAAGLEKMADGKSYFRYMKPMITEKSCLKCHAQQGYKVGDVRGGVSVSIPVDVPLAAENRETVALVSGHGLIWILGLFGIYAGGRRQRQSLLEVEQSEAEVRLLANSIAHAIYGEDLQGRCTFANAACLKMLGYDSEAELLGRDMHALMHHTRADGSPYPAEDCPTRRSLHERQVLHVDEEILWREDGSSFPAEFWTYPVMRDGQVQGAVVTFLDISEKKRIGDELLSSRQLLDSMVEHMPAMVFLKDAKELRFELFNRAGEEMLGYARRDLLGKNDHDLFPKEQADFFTRNDRAVLDSRRALEIVEEPITTADGREKWLHTFKVGLYDADKQPTHLLGVSIDITQRKQAEANLAKSRHNLADAQRIAHLGSWQMDLATNEVFWSDELYNLYGYDPAKPPPLYTESMKLFTPKSWERLSAAITRAVETGKPYELELEAVPKAGDRKWMLARGELERDAQGKPARVRGVVMDITARKLAEISLSKSRHNLAEAQRIAHIGSWELDLTSNTLFWSDEIYRMFEIDPEKFGASYEAFLDAIHPDDREAVNKAYTDSVQSRTPYEIEHRLLMRDGRIKYVQERCETTYDEAGKALRSTGTVQDITERKQAEIALEHANRALQTLSTVNRELVHAADEARLLQAICTAIVEQRDYRLAWVGYVRHDEAKSIELMASAGDDAGVLGQVRPSWAENEAGSGPSGRAVRSGRTEVVKEIAASRDVQPWKEELVRHGCVSSLALPLKSNGDVFGILHVYAEEADAFTEREIALLDEMAADLAFGVTTLRLRQERDRAVEQNEQHLIQIRESLAQAVAAIAKAVEARDPYTAGHQRRVAELAAAIAGAMGLDADRIEGIRMGATIHDIGKIQVPAEMLTKPAKLTEIEFQIIKEHPVIGYGILRDIHFPWPVADIAHQHHERLNGSGYPQGLKGEAICLEARIVAVADVVEAMSSHRPYRAGLGLEAALAEVSGNKGILYDGEAVEACLRVFADGFHFERQEVG